MTQSTLKPTPSFEQMEELLPGEVSHQVAEEFDQLQELPKELPYINHDGSPLEADEEDFHTLAHYEFYLRGLKL